jgi:hypothetical protein
MATRLYRCPNTGQMVQGWFADDGTENREHQYEAVTCIACRGLHYIDPKTGKVLGNAAVR